MRELHVANEREALEALASDALDFMLAGGRVTREEWGALSEMHRKAYVKAGEQFQAMQSNALAHEVLRRIDDALTAAKMDAVMERVGAA